ncbi:MAG: L,D-transpeptidase [Acidimicrobiales bacterium]|nr:L,D-transpeptidase [Acidimicrobiales bacterium]
MTRRWSALLTSALLLVAVACRDAGDSVAPAPAPTAGVSPPSTPTVVPDPSGATDGRFAAAEAVVPAVAVYDQADSTTPAHTLSNPNEQGAPLTFAVLGAQGDRLQVALPVRPNGSSGWIAAADVTVTRHSFRIEIRLAERELRVYNGDEIVQVEPIGVGQDPTPTPGGSYYLYELLQPPDPSGPYGPYAFGLSGFSEALSSFNGGDGRLGLHGTDDPSSIGTDSTHGCIRVTNDAVVQLAQTVPLGTPVAIIA